MDVFFIVGVGGGLAERGRLNATSIAWQLKLPSKWENLAYNDLIYFFDIITYLLLNTDYGIGCVYSPLGLDICGIRTDLYVFQLRSFDYIL